MMGLLKEIEQEEKSENKQSAWICLFIGILLALIGLVLAFGNNFHDFTIHGASSRFSSEMHDEVYSASDAKRIGVAVFIIAFFFFII